MPTRRSLALGLAALVPAGSLASPGPPRVEVWRDPGCGRCGGWVTHLRAEGFAVEDRVVPSVAPSRRPLGTPGMEVPGREPETYDVVAWRADGSHFPWLRMRGAGPA